MDPSGPALGQDHIVRLLKTSSHVPSVELPFSTPPENGDENTAKWTWTVDNVAWELYKHDSVHLRVEDEIWIDQTPQNAPEPKLSTQKDSRKKDQAEKAEQAQKPPKSTTPVPYTIIVCPSSPSRSLSRF
jgi:hypothetical protein